MAVILDFQEYRRKRNLISLDELTHEYTTKTSAADGYKKGHLNLRVNIDKDNVRIIYITKPDYWSLENFHMFRFEPAAKPFDVPTGTISIDSHSNFTRRHEFFYLDGIPDGPDAEYFNFETARRKKGDPEKKPVKFQPPLLEFVIGNEWEQMAREEYRMIKYNH